ncbi:MAG: hypothetical protein PUC23_04375 [bacterium]|nr:hypothetical protein [bacterium]
MYDLGYGDYYQSSATPGVASIVWAVLAIVLAIIGGLLVYFLFLNSKKDMKLNGFLKWLKDFLNFKTMILEVILKILYLISTIYVILLSFSFISSSFLTFLFILVFGPILVRVIYESSLMFIMIWKNTSEINKNTKK